MPTKRKKVATTKNTKSKFIFKKLNRDNQDEFVEHIKSFITEQKKGKDVYDYFGCTIKTNDNKHYQSYGVGFMDQTFDYVLQKAYMNENDINIRINSIVNSLYTASLEYIKISNNQNNIKKFVNDNGYYILNEIAIMCAFDYINNQKTFDVTREVYCHVHFIQRGDLYEPNTIVTNNLDEYIEALLLAYNLD